MPKALFLILFLLMGIASMGQANFAPADKWLDDNLHELGGRAVLMVWKDGKIIYSHAANSMNIREKIASKWVAKKQGKDPDNATQNFTTTTQQPIASCSKWLSAALVMTFVQDGKLGLNDTVGKYLPILTQNGKGNITIKDCLSHLTGIQAPPLKESLGELKTLKSMDEASANIAAMPMEGEPGKTFHYSNVGLQIAASVIEKISGKSFETLFQERIAQPCGMKNTSFGNAAVVLPAGGASSTAEDYLQFLIMLLQNGKYNGKQVLAPQSLLAMQQSYNTSATIAYSPAEAGNWGYGFGEWIIEIGDGNGKANVVSSPGLFGTFPWIDNKRQYAAILFSFNVNSKGRHERYSGLKSLIDKVVK
ncbi:serine hydrolase domain-containing protein [Parasediminibacterium sp. JCM 36343]|uniref:serine hydrolase domain-containing protein n=1 Tax=Parasediminibacterium sp. JCM 36343 TaxID=3374279 RepID=UPI00397C098A